MSRKRVERIFSHNSKGVVMVRVALGQDVSHTLDATHTNTHFSINFQIRKLLLGMNKTSDKQCFFGHSQLPTKHLIRGRVFVTYVGVSVLN